MKWIVRVLLGVIALLLLAAGALAALGMRSDAGVERASIEIARPPDAVWPWLVEGAKQKQWISWLVEVRESGPGKLVLVMVDPNNGNAREEIPEEVTEQDRPRKESVHIAMPGSFEGDASYILTDLGGARTRVETIGRYHYMEWMARLMEPLITRESAKKAAMDFAKLKMLVEAAPVETNAESERGTKQ